MPSPEATLALTTTRHRPTITSSWPDWRRLIALLRTREERWVRKHATLFEERLEEHAPGEELVGLPL
jgi:hypothetical protein